jgi:hypothetical protein
VSLDAIRDVLKRSRTEGAARLVLLVIAYHADRTTGESYASRKLLATEANVSTSTVHLALQELLNRGEIEISMTGGGRRSSTYRVLCSDSTIELLEPPVATRLSSHYEPVDNSVATRSTDRSDSMDPPVATRSAASPIRKEPKNIERFEPKFAAASSASTDLPATAVGRRSGNSHAVPPPVAAALQELKNGWRAQTVEAQQAEGRRQRELLGPAPTEGAPRDSGAADPEPKPEPPAGGRGGYGGYVPAWAAGQWQADHPDTDPQEPPE